MNRFISLEQVGADSNTSPNYESFGAIYYDKKDYRDQQPYFYSAFLKDGEMYSLRVADQEAGPVIDWNFRFES